MGEAKSWCSFSFPFLLAPALILWGLCVLGASLGSLSITTSFFVVFPCGSPIWTSTLFFVLGCFLLAVFRPGDQPPVMRSKAQAFFTFLASLLAFLETLVATGLSVWYFQVTYPVLDRCSPDHTGQSSDGFYTCECTEGFIKPPSLSRVVYRFERVPDCELIGTDLIVFKNVLLGLYCLGVVLSLVLTGTAVRKLRSVGFCGKSGTFLVNPELSRTSPVSGQPSLTSSHPSAAGHSSGYATVTVTQRFAVGAGGTSSYQASTVADCSPALSTARPHSPRALI